MLKFTYTQQLGIQNTHFSIWILAKTVSKPEEIEWKDQISFEGNGYVDLDKTLISHKPNYNWDLQIDISTYQPNGLLLWQGQIMGPGGRK